ncbi:hypothetical protein ACOI1H_21850, partial [Loktanella sp. DJP18]|uniref:hypothetical protein n=1 Tax=Loktanella sp. DJP18 TaxID=3409788 RepID=UPI003BB6B6E4
SASGRQLHALQYGSDTDGSRVKTNALPSELRRLCQTMHDIEREFTAIMKQSGLAVMPSQAAWEHDAAPASLLEQHSIIFINHHVYSHHAWYSMVHWYVRQCYLSFDPKSLDDLVEAVKEMPPLFAVMLAEMCTSAPQNLRSFMHDLKSALDGGLCVPELRILGTKHDLESQRITTKTWFDELAAQGVVRKAPKEGKVAYWSA